MDPITQPGLQLRGLPKKETETKRHLIQSNVEQPDAMGTPIFPGLVHLSPYATFSIPIGGSRVLSNSNINGNDNRACTGIIIQHKNSKNETVMAGVTSSQCNYFDEHMHLETQFEVKVGSAKNSSSPHTFSYHSTKRLQVGRLFVFNYVGPKDFPAATIGGNNLLNNIPGTRFQLASFGPGSSPGTTRCDIKSSSSTARVGENTLDSFKLDELYSTWSAATTTAEGTVFPCVDIETSGLADGELGGVLGNVSDNTVAGLVTSCGISDLGANGTYQFGYFLATNLDHNADDIYAAIDDGSFTTYVNMSYFDPPTDGPTISPTWQQLDASSGHSSTQLSTPEIVGIVVVSVGLLASGRKLVGMASSGCAKLLDFFSSSHQYQAASTDSEDEDQIVEMTEVTNPIQETS